MSTSIPAKCKKTINVISLHILLLEKFLFLCIVLSTIFDVTYNIIDLVGKCIYCMHDNRYNH